MSYGSRKQISGQNTGGGKGDYRDRALNRKFGGSGRQEGCLIGSYRGGGSPFGGRDWRLEDHTPAAPYVELALKLRGTTPFEMGSQPTQLRAIMIGIWGGVATPAPCHLGTTNYRK